MVIDGPFDVDQERRRVSLAPPDRALIENALSAVAAAVRVAAIRGDRGRQRLAQAAPPASADLGDLAWWKQALKKLAEKLARLPLVESTTGTWPAVKTADIDRFADFPLPRLDDASTVDEVPLMRVWALMAAFPDCDPPRREIAEDWCAIAAGWSALGVSVQQVSLRGCPEEKPLKICVVARATANEACAPNTQLT